MENQALKEFETCPYVTAQRLLQGKWSILILHHLYDGTLRFSELQRKMPFLTHASLSSQLKLLEGQGLISRKVYPEVPPRVEYSLTDIGLSFRPVLDEIGKWGNQYIDYLKEHPQAANQ